MSKPKEYELYIAGKLVAVSADHDWLVNEALPFHRSYRRGDAVIVVRGSR